MFTIINLIFVLLLILVIYFIMNHYSLLPTNKNVINNSKSSNLNFQVNENEVTKASIKQAQDRAQLFITPTDVLKSHYIGRNQPYGPYQMCGPNCVIGHQ